MTVLIAGGGTGGHVFPMLAVGQALANRGRSVDVFYVGTERGMEAREIPAAGGDLELLPVLPLRGGGLSGFLNGSVAAVRTLPMARKLLKRRRPDVVLSVGGYAAGPVSLAARSLGIPVAILEPNSHLGLSNRLMAPLANRAYTAFSEVEAQFRSSVVLRSGVPLRRAFSPSPFARKTAGLSILVLGGSLGATALNENVPKGLAIATESGLALSITHQAGAKWVPATIEAYRAAGVEANVTPFVSDVADALSSADLVIQRAGASSLAELCAVGRPSILIPYPFAADQHQLKNARSLQKAGAAITIEQAEASASRIAEEVIALAGAPGRLEEMARAALGLGRPEAAATIADDLLTMADQYRSKN